jgi:hypothetical protein
VRQLGVDVGFVAVPEWVGRSAFQLAAEQSEVVAPAIVSGQLVRLRAHQGAKAFVITQGLPALVGADPVQLAQPGAQRPFQLVEGSFGVAESCVAGRDAVVDLTGPDGVPGKAAVPDSQIAGLLGGV